MRYSKAPFRLKCYDICCGGGGLSLGFSQAGAHIIGGIDLNHYAIDTCHKRHSEARWECIDLYDFAERLVSDDEHPSREANVILAGLPCQGFSIAGKGNPGDNRNYLYRPLLKVVSTIMPDFVVFENVEGILHQKNSAIFGDICNGLERQGYSVSHRTLNASAFGVPQVRRRLFLVACRHFSAELVFEALRRRYERLTVKESLKGCSQKEPRSEIDHVFMKHGQAVTDKLKRLKYGGPISYRRLRWDAPAFTIISGHRALPVHPSEPRAISPREAARLQGFPDSYLFEGPVSSKIEQVANATPPPVARELARAIAKAWRRHSRPKSETAYRLTKNSNNTELKSIFIEYYDRHSADYPWRRSKNAFHVLLAELLLQRTDRFKVAKVWRDLVHICSSVKRTAELDSPDLHHIFKRIGIFSRAETVIQIADVISKFYNGRVPERWDELASLPGVGQYMASAVRVVAYGEQDFPVDSNAFRFVERYYGIDIHGRKSEARDIRESMKGFVPEDKSREFLFGFLDFMSKTCSSRKPDCNSCTLQSSCRSTQALGEIGEGQLEGVLGQGCTTPT